MSVETIVNAVEAEVKKVEAEAVVVAEKIEAGGEEAVSRVTQELDAEEKLAIREIENAYLKAQIEINRLSTITQKAQKDFTDKVESLTKRYMINPAEWLFDNVELIYRKK